MRLTSEKHLPRKIQACAHAHRLGLPRIVYTPRGSSRLHLVLGPLALAVSALIFGAYVVLYAQIFSWWPLWQAWLVLGVGLAWFLLGVWMLLPPLLAPPVRVFLCPKGLIYARYGYEAIRWDAIVCLSKTLRVAQQVSLLQKYTLLRADGRSFVLEGDLPYLDRLGGFMEREVTRLLLPQAIATYAAGSTLTFAEVAVTPQGLARAEQMLPWQAFERLNLDDTTLSIYRVGDAWAWLTLSLSDFPNVGVFKGLVDYATKYAHVPLEADPVAADATLSPLLMAYDAGDTLLFGSLRVSREGVRFSDGPRSELLPWEEIASFGVGEQEVIIKRLGSSDQWHTVPLWTVSDAASLRQVLDYALFQQYL